jgi:hypothetical protein
MLTDYSACISSQKMHQKQVASSAELSRAASICHFLPLDSIDLGKARGARMHRLKEKHVSLLTPVCLHHLRNEIREAHESQTGSPTCRIISTSSPPLIPQIDFSFKSRCLATLGAAGVSVSLLAQIQICTYHKCERLKAFQKLTVGFNGMMHMPHALTHIKVTPKSSLRTDMSSPQLPQRYGAWVNDVYSRV